MKSIVEFLKFSIEFILLVLIASSMSQEEWTEEWEKE